MRFNAKRREIRLSHGEGNPPEMKIVEVEWGWGGVQES